MINITLWLLIGIISWAGMDYLENREVKIETYGELLYATLITAAGPFGLIMFIFTLLAYIGMWIEENNIMNKPIRHRRRKR